MRYSGMIGFKMTVNKGHGIWEEEIVEKPYKGDVIKNSYRNQQGESINDNITISNIISIVAQDNFIMPNLSSIIYCVWKGIKWKVSSIDVQTPRLNLSLGGEYNDAT